MVTAEVGDASTSWRNAAGVPVITKGNPKSGIQVVVTEVAVASPSPTATPSASPIPAPAPDLTSSGNLLTWIILIAIIGAIVAFLVAAAGREPDAAAGRCRRARPPRPPPPPASASAADDAPGDEALGRPTPGAPPVPSGGGAR